MGNNIECEVIKDLLPGYIAGTVSKDTIQMIEEHISSCEECKKLIESMKATMISKVIKDNKSNFLERLSIKSKIILLFLFCINNAIFFISLYLSNINEKDSFVFVVFIHFLALIMISIKYALPLFIAVASVYLYEKKKKKRWIAVSFIFSIIYIIFIIIMFRQNFIFSIF